MTACSLVWAVEGLVSMDQGSRYRNAFLAMSSSAAFNCSCGMCALVLFSVCGSGVRLPAFLAMSACCVVLQMWHVRTGFG
jgi:hypothetical protein